MLRLKDDKLIELRKALATYKLEADKLRLDNTGKDRQIKALSVERNISRSALIDTAATAKKLESKLQLTSSLIEELQSTKSSEIHEKDLKEKCFLLTRRNEKQHEELTNLVKENAILNRALNLHAADMRTSARSIKDDAQLSIEIERLQAELDRAAQEKTEVIKLRDQISILEDNLDRQSRMLDISEKRVAELGKFESLFHEQETQNFLMESRMNAANDEMRKLSSSSREMRRALDQQEFAVLSSSQQLESSTMIITEEKNRRELLKDKIEELQKSKAAAEIRANQLEKEVENQRINLCAQKEIISRLEDQIQLNKQVVLEWKKKANDLQDQLRSLRSQSAAFELKIGSLDSALNKSDLDKKDLMRFVESKNREISTYKSLLSADTVVKAKRLINSQLD